MASNKEIQQNKYNFALNESNNPDETPTPNNLYVPEENNFKSNVSANYRSKNISEIRDHYASKKGQNNNLSKGAYESNRSKNLNSKYESNKEIRELEVKNYNEQYNSMYDPHKQDKPMFDLNRYTKDEKIIMEKTDKVEQLALQDPNISEAIKYRDKNCDWVIYTLLILVSIWFMVWFIIEIAEEDYFMTQSISFIKTLQKGGQDAGYYVFWITSWPLYWIWPAWPFICLHYYNDKLQGLKSLTVILVNYYQIRIFKMIYAESRPNFVSADIKEWDCSCTYGNPSGHTATAMCLYQTIAWDMCVRHKQYRYCTRTVILILAIIVAFLIGFGRIYLGSQGFHAVLYGGSIGLMVFLLFALPAVEKKLNIFYNNLINNAHKNNVPMVITACSVSLFLFLLYFAVYCIAHSKYKSPTFNNCQTCAEGKLVNHEFFNGLYSLLMPSVLLGLICSNVKYEYDQDYFVNQFNCKGILRFIIFLVCWLPVISVFIVKGYLDNVSYAVFIILGIAYVFMTLLSSVLIFIVVPKLFRHWGLEVRGDLRAKIQKKKTSKKEQPENQEHPENASKFDEHSFNIDSNHANQNIKVEKVNRYSNADDGHFNSNYWANSNARPVQENTGVKDKPIEVMVEGDVFIQIEDDKSDQVHDAYAYLDIKNSCNLDNSELQNIAVNNDENIKVDEFNWNA